MLITEYYPQFFTATILEWKHLLVEDKYKDIIIESLRFLVKEKGYHLFICNNAKSYSYYMANSGRT